MNQRQIARFFEILADRFDEECQIILTGAAAGALYGRVRPTADIDFSLKLKKKSARGYEQSWQRFAKAIRETGVRTGIAAQYGEDIDHWSSITLLDYQKHKYLFRRFGKIKVYLMEPSYWAIGKLGRYLDSDIRDLVHVLKKTDTSWQALAPLLGKALRESPKSTACFSFRKQVEDFLKTYGRQIWGKNYSPEKAVKQFHEHAQIPIIISDTCEAGIEGGL